MKTLLRTQKILNICVIFLTIANSIPAGAAELTAKVANPTHSRAVTTTSTAVGSTAASQPTIQVPANEFYVLQKVAVLKESQSEIVEGLQTKFWIFVVVAAIVGVFGIRSLVREFIASELKDAMRAAADAQAATTLAKDSVKELRSEAAKYRESVEEATQTATSLNSKLDELRSRIETEGERSVAAAEIKVEGVQAQIDTLKSMIDKIADRQAPGTELPKQAAETLERAKQKTSSDEEEFLRRSGTRIAIASTESSSELGDVLAKRLSRLGYRIRTSVWSGFGRESGTLEIQYMPHAKEQAKTIEHFLRSKLGGNLKVKSIATLEVDRPVRNTNDEVILLLS
jgi:flagellar biosynthesis chaperone FliJ